MAVSEIHVRGAVQGVGFRPAVYAVANAMNLTGSVMNTREGVCITLDCELPVAEELLSRVAAILPPVARIDDTRISVAEGFTGRKRFVIQSSLDKGEYPTDIVPDIAVCTDCLNDMSKPGKRFRYPLTNCTVCGPRYSIVRALPYDRRSTTMTEFEMCDDCAREYDDPSDRRHHAQPISCNDCGPKMRMRLTDGSVLTDYDRILSEAYRQLDSGATLVCKGIGGYNLIADARSEDAIGRLRELKHRPRKPFAVMAKNMETASQLGIFGDAEYEALSSWRAPIVIVHALDGVLPEIVAPGCRSIGIMLPYTPIHHDLCRDGRILAVTSANRSGEPIIIDDLTAEVYARQHSLALVWFDRLIANRLDDSVVRLIDGKIRLLRRSRGYVPEPVSDVVYCEGILGMGADITSQWAFGRGSDIIQGPYVGKLTDEGIRRAFQSGIENMARIYDFCPRTIVVDMHPGYTSGFVGKTLAEKQKCEIMEMQHHHAHAVSVMADMGIEGEVLALVLDGTGYGPDGTMWGAELLRCDRTKYTRLVHGDYLPMPGGDKAALEPWRMAVSWVWSVNRSIERLPEAMVRAIGSDKIRAIASMLEKRINSPLSCGAGRVFDAVAALIGLSYQNGYESESPILLEGAARRAGDCRAYRINVIRPMDLSPMLEAILNDVEAGVDPGVIAARFHSTYSEICYRVVLEASMRSGLKRVVLSGGVMQNSLFVDKLAALLRKAGLEVFLPERVCAGDGGIPVGQVAFAAASRTKC